MVWLLIGIVSLLIILILLLVSYYRYQAIKVKQSLVSYLVVPPAFGVVPETPEKLYSLVKDLLRSKDHHLALNKKSVILEVISSSNGGIRFVISSSLEISEALKSLLIAYWPKLEIKKIREGNGLAIAQNSQYRLRNWRPTEEFFTSLDDQQDNSLGFLLGSLSGLKKDESIGLQLILQSDDLVFTKKLKRIVKGFIRSIVRLVGMLLVDTIRGQLVVNNRSTKQLVAKQTKSSLRVSIRTLIGSPHQERLKTLNLTVETAIRGYGLVPKGLSSRNNNNKLTGFVNRQASNSIDIPIKGLARLYYFPLPNADLKEDLGLSRSVSLPIPNTLKTRSKPAVVVGIANNDNDNQKLIGLNVDERQRHMLIVGGTGMGKSSLLGYSIVQDMLSNKGLALIDPHGDLAEEVVGHIPTRRLDEVIYIDPTDIGHPIGLNLMELPTGLSSEELEIAKDLVAESIVSIFHKIFSDDDSGGHRIEYVLRNAIHTAFNVPGATLFTIHKLLTNDLFRASVVSTLEDGSLKDFWYGEFNKAGSYQKVKMISGVTAKLGRFQRSVVTRRIIEQPKSTIDFNDIINHKKILIGNFAKGGIGEDTSSLLSMLVLAKLQLSAWQRSLMAKTSRLPFYLYVDEFQNFSSPMFSQLVSESRKFGLNLILAEQTTAYQDENEVNILLANVGNIVCFRTASELDSKRLGVLFEPYVSRYDLNNLKPYNFYMRLASGLTQEPLSGTTLLIKGQPKSTTKNRVVNYTRQNYTLPYVIKSESAKLKATNRVPMKYS